MPAAIPTCWPARHGFAARGGEGSLSPRRKKTARDCRAATKRRLSFNEKHALETLPKTIATLQTEIARQQTRLDDPNLYAKDRKSFDEASNAMAKAQQELAAAEDRWLELEVLREEIEQA